MTQPMTIVPAILRQISGSIEDAMNALTNQQSFPHTPQIHPDPLHTPHDNPRDDTGENNKFFVEGNENKDRLPRPTVCTAPSGGRVTGPLLGSPATVAPAPYFNSNNTSNNNDREGMLPITTQPAGMSAHQKIDRTGVLEHRLPPSSPTVAIHHHHHRERSDTMTPLI